MGWDKSARGRWERDADSVRWFPLRLPPLLGVLGWAAAIFYYAWQVSTLSRPERARAGRSAGRKGPDDEKVETGGEGVAMAPWNEGELTAPYSTIYMPTEI